MCFEIEAEPRSRFYLAVFYAQVYCFVSVTGLRRDQRLDELLNGENLERRDRGLIEALSKQLPGGGGGTPKTTKTPESGQ
jgi:hypothetical protein